MRKPLYALRIPGAHMIDTYLLEQLIAVKECGTLSAASEKLNLTQPSLTRSMQKLEKLLGVPLFDREKNRVALNENGILAAEHANLILLEEQNMIDQVRALDRSKRMITVGTIAPGPMFELSPLLSSIYPDKTISTEVRKEEEELLQGLADRTYQMIILNHSFESPAINCVPCGIEQLFFSVPRDHRIAKREECSFAEMNGESFLMAAEVGYWEQIVRKNLPNSRFLLQNDLDALLEIIKSSTVPSFATDVTNRTINSPEENRAYIRITDEDATEYFYCCCRSDEAKKYQRWFQVLEKRYIKR